MLTLQHISYAHPNKEVLFSDINLSVNRNDKIALVGNNGTGKSTLLQLLAGRLQPSAGAINSTATLYYVPQVFGQYNNYSIAQALGIDDKLKALHDILAGNVTEDNLTVLNDDWTIEERCAEALAHWQLYDLKPHTKMDTLSGGQKTRVFLAGMLIHQADIILLDEPSNHLDVESRSLLYNYIRSTSQTLIVVSHDRALLNLLTIVFELSHKGITAYGGNYDFYKEQKQVESLALDQDVKSKEKALRKARDTEREAIERQQKLDARGRSKQEQAGMPTIMIHTLKNNAERSTAKLKEVHSNKIEGLQQELNELRKTLPGIDKMKLGFDDSNLHRGKVLITAKDINISFDDRLLWNEDLNLQVNSGERIAIKGNNGSGKTSLVKMLLGNLQPVTGHVQRTQIQTIYIDQDYSLLDNQLSVYQQVQLFNTAHLQEHEVKSRLTHFLFDKNDWDKTCASLSGGERLRLILCCLTVGKYAPDMIVLDEPTNNLDIQNADILTAAIKDYKGTLLIISHDDVFLQHVGVDKTIEL